MNVHVESIRDKWESVRDKHVEVSFPKGIDQKVVDCIVGAARGDVYFLLDYIARQDKEIRHLKMKRDGVTEQDVAETMPPRPGEMA